MTNNNLSQEMIENIKNYGNEIITIENWVEQVRQNIGMWIMNMIMDLQ